MKKLGVLLALIFSCTIASAYQFSDKFSNTIKENDRIEYSISENSWKRTMDDADYTFVKYITTGTGGFSEYKYKNKKYDTGTTYEFLYDKKLIGYNHHTLKFTYLDFDGAKFNHKELTTEELKKFFPDVEFVKISDFKDRKITLYKPLLSTKHYLLVNDTDEDYYKYFFEKYNNERTLFRALFTARFPGTFIYSHFGSRDNLTPPLYIYVKAKGLF